MVRLRFSYISKKRIFAFLCFLSGFILFTTFFLSHPNEHLFLTLSKTVKYQSNKELTVIASRRRNPLNDLFLNKFKEAMDGDSVGSMKGVYGPLGLGGTGNAMMGMLNMITYSIFSDAIFIFPKSSLFNDLKTSFSDYVSFVEPELEKYVVYPSPHNERILSNMTHDCSLGIHSFETLCLIDHLRGCLPLHENIRGHGDFLKSCDNDLCRRLFLSNEKENVIHRQEGDVNFNCFPTYIYQYPLANLFRSKEKTKYLCDTLQLCEGINTTFATNHCQDRSCYVSGLTLSRNVWQAVFQLSETKFLEMRNKYEKVESWYRSRMNGGIMIAVHLRSIFINRRDPVFETQNCLIEVIDYITEKRGKSDDDFQIVLTADNEVVFDLEEMKNEMIEQKKIGKLSFNDINFYKFAIGDVGTHWVANSKNTTKDQLFLDLYFLSRSDYVIFTEGSTFSQMGYFFGDYTEENMFVIPVDRFTEESFREEYRPCTRSISLLNFLVHRE